MNKEMIILELRNRGYEIKEESIERNNVVRDGFSIIKEDVNIAPLFKVDELIEIAEKKGLSLKALVDEIEQLYEEVKQDESFDLEKFLNTDFILKHIKIGLQQISDEPIEKRDTEYEGIESYLYISDSSKQLKGNISMRLTNPLRAKLNIDDEVLWNTAKANTFKDTHVYGLREALDLEFDCNMWIITNKQGIKGASAILDKASLNKLALQLNVSRFIMIPSSVHECIVIPADEQMCDDVEYYSNMVNTVNSEVLKSEDKLSDKAYVINTNVLTPILK